MELRRILQKCETRMCIHYVLNGHKQEVTKIKHCKMFVENAEELWQKCSSELDFNEAVKEKTTQN